MANKDWTDSLRSRIEGGNPPAPEVAWDELSAGMDRIVRRRRAIGVLSAAAAVAAVFWLMPHDEPAVPSVAEVAVVETPVLPEPANLLAEALPVRQRASRLCEIIEYQIIPETIEIQPSAGNDVPPEESTIKTEDNIMPSDDYWDQPEDEPEAMHRRKRLSIGVGSGLMGGNGEYGDNPIQNGPSGGGIMSDPTIPQVPQTLAVKMSAPLTFGISARYDVGDRLFALGGVHASVFDTDYLGRAWYLGPSFGLGYDMLRSSEAGIYAAVTGNAGWCVSRRDLPPQFSAALAAGTQLHLEGPAWVYLEPQVRYSFPASNDRFVITRDSPFQFTINLGLRFNF